MSRIASTFNLAAQAWSRLVAVLESLQPAAALAARIYVAHAFFVSGLKVP